MSDTIWNGVVSFSAVLALACQTLKEKSLHPCNDSPLSYLREQFAIVADLPTDKTLFRIPLGRLQ